MTEAQLNCICDGLTKAIINDAIGHGSNTIDILPLEDACVFVGGDNQTTDVAKGLIFSVGR